ncbi:UNVERIFIED_CONTAM: hypothetical protein K2H54_044933 [Gekko kuhli]
MMEIDKTGRSTNLTIHEVEMEDDAVYYCAASDTVVGSARGPEPKHGRGVLLSSSLSGFQETCMHVTRYGWGQDGGPKTKIFVSVLLESPSATAGKTMPFSYTWAVFILSVLSILGRAQKIDQPGSATALERSSYNLSCNLSSVSTEKVLWYRQFPGRGPQYIAGLYAGYQERSANPDSTLYFPKDKKSTTLVLHHVTLTDAAVYFCALSGAQWLREGRSLRINPTQRQGKC